MLLLLLWCLLMFDEFGPAGAKSRVLATQRVEEDFKARVAFAFTFKSTQLHSLQQQQQQ